MKTFLLAFLLTFNLQTSRADQTCEAQLEAKDKIIMALNQTIQVLASRNTGDVVVHPASTWTCETVCIQNLIGKGWSKPGQLFQSSILVSALTPEAAFNSMMAKCESDTKNTFEKNTDRFSSANVAGIMTKAEMNSPDWESKMVKSFNSEVSVYKFCRHSL